VTDNSVRSVVCVGVGGQGVLTVSEVLAQAAFVAGYDVKKSEVHGLSQRGGSVTSAVRFGSKVHAPLVPAGEVDLLLGFEPNETVRSRHLVRDGGVVVEPSPELIEACADLPRTLNIAVLGAASRHLPFPLEAWEKAVSMCVPPKTIEINLRAFQIGRGKERG
jgi:indolepyruvate ferredoxin oxidoreductase beta subunit